MRIAVLSGKGGAGKTLLAVNLAAVAGRAVYADCDVEEPNGHLYFRQEVAAVRSVYTSIPQIDGGLCIGCHKCVETCRFHALAFIRNGPVLFREVCHSCGACMFVCPAHAITEADREIGKISAGNSGSTTVLSGIMNTGETTGVPIIRELLHEIQADDRLTVIDCPPGSACLVMESIKGADFCLLIAEPTIFGAHNLKIVYELARIFGKPSGVVLNKCTQDDNPSEAFCKQNNIKILGRIPFDKRLGELHSNGLIAVSRETDYQNIFTGILIGIGKEVRREAAIDTQR